MPKLSTSCWDYILVLLNSLKMCSGKIVFHVSDSLNI